MRRSIQEGIAATKADLEYVGFWQPGQGPGEDWLGLFSDDAKPSQRLHDILEARTDDLARIHRAVFEQGNLAAQMVLQRAGEAVVRAHAPLWLHTREISRDDLFLDQEDNDRAGSSAPRLSANALAALGGSVESWGYWPADFYKWIVLRFPKTLNSELRKERNDRATAGVKHWPAKGRQCSLCERKFMLRIAYRKHLNWTGSCATDKELRDFGLRQVKSGEWTVADDSRRSKRELWIPRGGTPSPVLLDAPIERADGGEPRFQQDRLTYNGLAEPDRGGDIYDPTLRECEANRLAVLVHAAIQKLPDKPRPLRSLFAYLLDNDYDWMSEESTPGLLAEFADQHGKTQGAVKKWLLEAKQHPAFRRALLQLHLQHQ